MITLAVSRLWPQSEGRDAAPHTGGEERRPGEEGEGREARCSTPAQLGLDEPEVLGELEDDEGELAAAGEQQRDADGLGARQPEGEGAEREDEPELRGEEGHLCPHTVHQISRAHL